MNAKLRFLRLLDAPFLLFLFEPFCADLVLWVVFLFCICLVVPELFLVLSSMLHLLLEPIITIFFVHVINYFDNFRKYKQSNCLRKRGICASFLTVADTVKYDFFNVSLIIPDVISHIGIFLFYHMCRA